MISATPALWLPPEKPAIIRANAISRIPSWEEMRRRTERRAMFPFPFFIPATSTVALGSITSIGTNTGSGSSLAITTSATAPIGSRIIVLGGNNVSASLTCSDGTNTYSTLDTSDMSANTMFIRVFGSNQLTSALNSGSTITISGGASIRYAMAFYLVGVTTGPPITDITGQTANGSSGTPTTLNTGTLAISNEFVLGIITSVNAPGQPGGWTTIASTNQSTNYVSWAYKIVASTSSVGYSPTSGGTYWGDMMLTIKGQ